MTSGSCGWREGGGGGGGPQVARWTSHVLDASRVVIYGQFINNKLISDKETL